jgi:endoglucanase
MKNLFAFLFAALLLSALAACSGYSSQHQPVPIAPPSEPAYVPPVPTPREGIVQNSPASSLADVTGPLDRAMFTIPDFAMTPGVVTDDFIEMTATEWVASVGMGWNLGNTFDAAGGARGFHWLGGGVYANTTVDEMERAWVGAATTREMIDNVASTGFNTIRIPVTWFKALDEDLNIREDWMDRINEVVDWAMDNDMFVIINSHHDEYIFRLWNDDMLDSQHVFARVWQQIAYRFRDYDERVMFEALNEPRTPGSANEWSGGTAEERNNLNILNQLFVDVVRASGGNNAYRVLMVPTYAASISATAQRALVVPTDTVPDRIVVSLHTYAPFNFALQTGDGATPYWDAESSLSTNPIRNPLQLAYDIFVSQGIPVIIGEMGAMNRDNEETRAEWVYYFVTFARSLGMASIWWDNGATGITSGSGETFGLFNRSTATVEFPLIIDAIRRATED